MTQIKARTPDTVAGHDRHQPDRAGRRGRRAYPQISATIQQLFRGAERGRAFGYYASIVAVSSAIGPLAAASAT
jgi:hypothetical protein